MSNATDRAYAAYIEFVSVFTALCKRSVNSFVPGVDNKFNRYLYSRSVYWQYKSTAYVYTYVYACVYVFIIYLFANDKGAIFAKTGDYDIARMAYYASRRIHVYIHKYTTVAHSRDSSDLEINTILQQYSQMYTMYIRTRYGQAIMMSIELVNAVLSFYK